LIVKYHVARRWAEHHSFTRFFALAARDCWRRRLQYFHKLDFSRHQRRPHWLWDRRRMDVADKSLLASDTRTFFCTT